METLLEIKGLAKHFLIPAGGLLRKKFNTLKAVDGVSFSIPKGTCFGVAGESGSGKTTISKLVLLEEKPTEGAILFEGKNIGSFTRQEIMQYRRRVQPVFQDASSSLDPNMRIIDIVCEPMAIQQKTLPRKATLLKGEKLLYLVGIGPESLRKYPHELSGGQKQRVAIARAISLDPSLVILDEPVSALDVSIRAQILNLLADIQDERQLTYLVIAHDLAKDLPKCKAFIADPVVVDELQDVARIAGHPVFQRYSIFHALNQKATARAYARLMNHKYEELNLVIAHLGGGVSVGAHRKGRVIDVNQALDGEGPFSPERSGTLPSGALVKLCFDGKYSLDEIKRMITGEGGYVAYMGTNSAYEVELLAQDGDERARLIQDAMSYQIGKEIASMCAVLHGDIDAIILTGGISHNPMVVEYIKKMVSFMAPVVIYPGEDEMHALAMNGLMVLKGEVKPREYEESTMVNVKLPCWECKDREKDELMKSYE